jgi:hypothetical protein
MDKIVIKQGQMPDIEIIAPERPLDHRNGQECLCCGRAQHRFDDDCCGISEECLAP